MPPLYVVEQGAVLHKEGERLTVRKDGQALLSVPVFKLDTVILFGAVQVTTQAISLLLANGVELSFMSIDGRLKGRLLPAHSRNVPLRLQQYERYHDPAFRLRLSRAFVRGKIRNARALVLRYMRNHPEADLEECAHVLADAIAHVEGIENLNALRGLEGRASASYFAAFARMIRSDLKFFGRTRRPPTDPVNALLSLGYSLLTHELFGALAARGLDPYIGFYHEIRHGRPALALDLAEEFRAPLVDRHVLWLVNKRILRPTDFLTDDIEGGVRLKPDALRKYLVLYEQRLRRGIPGREPGSRTWRQVLRSQVEQLVQAVRLAIAYQPANVEV